MRKIFLAASVIILALIACEKGTGYVDPSLPVVGAKVKFINNSWNAPSLIFYGKDTTFKFSSALAATGGILQGTAFGSTYPSNDYAVVSPYSDVLKVKVPLNSTVSPGAFFDLGPLTLEDDANYSVFLIDSFPQVSKLVVRDTLKNFNTIPDSTYYARFVNLVYGLPTGPTVDIFSKNENAVIFSNIPYKGVTSFKNFKVYPAQEELQLRLAGTTTILARLLYTPAQKRTYTGFSRGRSGSTVTATAPALVFYTNQ